MNTHPLHPRPRNLRNRWILAGLAALLAAPACPWFFGVSEDEKNDEEKNYNLEVYVTGEGSGNGSLYRAASYGVPGASPVCRFVAGVLTELFGREPDGGVCRLWTAFRADGVADITLVAEPDVGSRLVGWGNCGPPGDTRCGQIVGINTTQDIRRNVTVNFELEEEPPPPPPEPPPAGTPITWTGGAGTADWLSAGNWDLNRVPGSGDAVIINPGASVRYHSDNVEIVRLQLGGNLLVDSDGLLLIKHGIMGSNGTLTIRGPSGAARLSSVSIDSNSTLKAVHLEGLAQLTKSTYGEQTYESTPTLTVETMFTKPNSGTGTPRTNYVHLLVTQSGAIDESLALAGLGTLEVGPTAVLDWTAATTARLGTNGFYSGRFVNHGTVNIRMSSASIHPAVENRGRINVERALAMLNGGLNSGAIVSSSTVGTLVFRGQSPTLSDEWTLRPSGDVEASQITVGASGELDGSILATNLTIESSTTRTNTIQLSNVHVDSLLVMAKVVLTSPNAEHSLLHLTVSSAGAELELPDHPGPFNAFQLKVRRFRIETGATLRGQLLVADSLMVGGGVAQLRNGRMMISDHSIVFGGLIGSLSWMDLYGVLELNPSSGGTIKIETERPDVGVDLTLRNFGTIRKRGLGTANIRACLPNGIGTVVNDPGATPLTVEQLSC